MSDYMKTWSLRQQYYSSEAVAARQQADMERQVQHQVAEEEEVARNVFGGRGDVSHLFKKRPGSKEGDLGAQIEDAAIFGGELVAHGADAVPSIGMGLINATNNVLDFGAHVVGLEDHYRGFTDWAHDNLPVYRPTTASGPLVGAVTQVGVPYFGTAKLLQAAGASSLFATIIASGTAEGLAIGAGDDNLADLAQRFVDTSPEAPSLVREVIIDSLAKTDEQLQILHEAEQHQAAGGDLGESGKNADSQVAAPFDAETYRQAYFNARLKNALSGVVADAVGEGILRTAGGIYRTAIAMRSKTTRQALMANMRAAGEELVANARNAGPGPSFGSPAAQRGSFDPYFAYQAARHADESTVSEAGAARAMQTSTVPAARQLLEEAETVRTRNVTHQELQQIFPPETRRAGPLAPGARYTTASGGRFADLDLEAPAAPGANINDEDIDALWEESIQFMETQGYDVRNIVNELRAVKQGGKSVKEVYPKAADFWKRSLELPNRARYWYEISSEGMRDLLPDLSDEEFKAFIDIVGMTSQSTAPTPNMMRAIGITSQTLRGLPSEQDVIDPVKILRTFGQTNEGLKVGSFSGTFQHHLGLNDMPQLSTNDRQVASTFGMGPTDIAGNPVMYGVLSRFYQNLRDHLNKGVPEGGETWETWQLQAMGWVQERIEGGNTDFDDYLDVLTRLSSKAKEAGLPVGPNGELTREVLMDPRLDPLMGTTIEEYRRKMKAGLPITGRSSAYDASVGMRKEFEMLGDIKAVENWEAMERRALKGLMYTRRTNVLDADGNKVWTDKREKKTTSAPSPASSLASALTGKAETISRTAVGSNEGGYASRIPLPADATQDELAAWLSVMGQETGQATVRAGRFNYMSRVPNRLEEGKHATSVLYQVPKPLSGDQVQAFQKAMGSDWQVDAHVSPNGMTLDVHPDKGISAPPEQLEAALTAAGLDPKYARVVYSDYTGVSIDKAQYAGAVTRWRTNIVRNEAKAFAQQLGGMGNARQILMGKEPVPSDVPGGKAFRAKVAKAQARIAARMAALEEARGAVKEVRKRLDADAKAYIEKHEKRLENQRRKAVRK